MEASNYICDYYDSLDPSYHVNRLLVLLIVLIPFSSFGQTEYEIDSVEIFNTAELTLQSLKTNNFDQFERLSAPTVSCQPCLNIGIDNNNLPLIPKQFFDLYQSSEDLRKLLSIGMNADSYALKFLGKDRTAAIIWYSVKNKDQSELGIVYELYFEVFKLAGVKTKTVKAGG